MLRHKLHRTFPVFFAYICFQILLSASCSRCIKWGTYSYTQYFWFYWACAAVNLVLGFMVIHEIFLDVFRPYHTLKDLGSVLFKWAALVMSAGGFRGRGIQPYRGSGADRAGGNHGHALRARGPGRADFVSHGFSRYLGVSWQQHSFGISLGLGFSAGVELGTLAFHVSGHASEVSVHVINLVAYNIAILIWFAMPCSRVRRERRKRAHWPRTAGNGVSPSSESGARLIL